MFIYLIPIVSTLFITIFYSIFTFLKTKNIKKVLLKSTLLDFVFLAVASIWWFYYTVDGISQAFGIGYYALAFVGIGFMKFFTLWVIKNYEGEH